MTLEEAPDYIFGYSCLIDVTMRGKEERVMRKSLFDVHDRRSVDHDRRWSGPTGDLELQLWVNGTLRQHAFAREMVVGIYPKRSNCVRG